MVGAIEFPVPSGTAVASFDYETRFDPTDGSVLSVSDIQKRHHRFAPVKNAFDAGRSSHGR